MCDRCDLIDYPIADCWRPCYDPTRRERSPGYIPTTPRGGFDDYDFDAQKRVDDLMHVIRKQRAEISTLKAKQSPPDSRDSFEGVE